MREPLAISRAALILRGLRESAALFLMPGAVEFTNGQTLTPPLNMLRLHSSKGVAGCVGGLSACYPAWGYPRPRNTCGVTSHTGRIGSALLREKAACSAGPA